MSYNTRIKLKSDTESNWLSQDPVLLDGEVAIVKCDGGITRKKIGDGSKKFSELAYDESKSLGLASAAVGQIPKVKAVDSSGRPTEWEPVELPSSGTGTSVQSNWNQNDETASDYIKNRPFYTINMDSITWDGSTDGKITTEKGFYYLVSEQEFNESYFLGATITVISTTLSTGTSEKEGAVVASWKATESFNNHVATNNIVKFYESSGSEVSFMYYILEDNTEQIVSASSSFLFPKKGLYFMRYEVDGTLMYVSSLVPSGANNKYKTLNPNYLPTATTTSIGAIKVGNGLSISADGTLSVTTATYYTGTADPVNTLGADGDLYLKTEG